MLRPAEGGLPRAGRADIAGYFRAYFEKTPGARLELIAAQPAPAPSARAGLRALWRTQELPWCAVLILRRGPADVWQIADATFWAAAASAADVAQCR